MATVAVFDSGLGSLSIIKAIQNYCKTRIIYFADRKSFPYGKKSKSDLSRLIQNSINLLEERFHPDLIVVGSNTPTLILDIESEKIIGVNPPLKEASQQSKTKNIGILASSSTVKSKGLRDYIANSGLDKFIFHKIDSSSLIDLVESGKFLTNKPFCEKKIKETLQKIIINKKIDVCTLSSTHLPFLRDFLHKVFPDVKFVDPAEKIAKLIAKKIKNQTRNSLEIYSSGGIETFEKNLELLGIKNKVKLLTF